jgi:hypothetical protein
MIKRELNELKQNIQDEYGRVLNRCVNLSNFIVRNRSEMDITLHAKLCEQLYYMEKYIQNLRDLFLILNIDW